jgi:hypothetical protein
MARQPTASSSHDGVCPDAPSITESPLEDCRTPVTRWRAIELTVNGPGGRPYGPDNQRQKEVSTTRVILRSGPLPQSGKHIAFQCPVRSCSWKPHSQSSAARNSPVPIRR